MALLEIILKHEVLTVYKINGAELQRFIQTALGTPYPLFKAEKWEKDSLHLIEVNDRLDSFDQNDLDVFMGVKKSPVEIYPSVRAMLCYLAKENLIHIGTYLVTI